MGDRVEVESSPEVANVPEHPRRSRVPAVRDQGLQQILVTAPRLLILLRLAADQAGPRPSPVAQTEHVCPTLRPASGVVRDITVCHLSVRYLAVDILAEAGRQPLYPQDQVAVMTQGVHHQLVVLVFRILVAVNQHHDVPLEREHRAAVSPRLIPNPLGVRKGDSKGSLQNECEFLLMKLLRHPPAQQLVLSCSPLRK